MYKLSTTGFVRPDGRATRVIMAGGAGSGGEKCDARQRAALPGYLRELDAVTPETQRLYQLFGWYLACAVLTGGGKKILDVGCGIGTCYPPYVRPLEHALGANRIMYVGLDPMPENATDRGYPFICGRIEDVPSVLEDRFDVFLFATSLDHFEDTAAVARAVRQLAAEHALALFWIGLHDVAIVAEQIGGAVFQRLFASLAPAGFCARYARAALQELKAYLSLRKRQAKLDAGKALDDLHFHYFTQANVGAVLRLFGELQDVLRVPGTNSMFATVLIN